LTLSQLLPIVILLVDRIGPLLYFFVGRVGE